MGWDGDVYLVRGVGKVDGRDGRDGGTVLDLRVVSGFSM